MNSNTLSIFKAVIFSTFICLFITTSSYGGEYEALDGLKDISGQKKLRRLQFTLISYMRPSRIRAFVMCQNNLIL